MRQWLVTLCVIVSLTISSVVPIDAQLLGSGAHDPQDHSSLMPADFQSDPIDLSKVHFYPATSSGWKTVIGWPGAVKGKAGVNLTNRRTGERRVVDASPDGSFYISIQATEEDKLLLVAHNTLPAAYSAAPLEAWVKDGDTGQPLDGVIVVAQWELKGGLHPDAVGSLMVMETVTDTNGRFSFSAWGPRLAPLGTYIQHADPKLLLFKPDYEPERLYNKHGRIDRSPLRHSDWHGKTIPLKKFIGPLKDYASRVGSLDDDLDFAFRYDDCTWKQIPRMLIALDQEETRLLRAADKKYEAVEHVGIKDWEERFGSQLQKCGSMMDFLRSYLP